MKALGFREIADELRKQVVEGKYAPGSRLPAEPELAKEFGGASRSLVNRAMQLLAAEGIVRPKQGRGTIVTWLPPIVHSPARYSRQVREQGGARGAFDGEIKDLGLTPAHEITVSHDVPPSEVAELLELETGQPNALVRRRRLLASGIPVRINASWFPLEIAQGTVLEEEGPVIVGGVKSALAELGYPQVKASERYVIRRPSDEEIAALEISPERDVIEITHTGQTAEGRIVEVTMTVAPANRLIIETGEFPLN